MKLKDYDNKCIKIICPNGDVFEGSCIYNSSEYNEHEYGRKEDSLQIENFLFYKNDIQEIINLENHQGPYGKFTTRYSMLERLNVKDGIDTINEILFEDEDDEEIYRFLLCIDDYFSELTNQQEILKSLTKMLEYNKDQKINSLISKMLNKWNK